MSRGTRTGRERDAALVSLRACGLLRSPDTQRLTAEGTCHYEFTQQVFRT